MTTKAVSSNNFSFLGPIVTATVKCSDIFGVYTFPGEFVMRSERTGECRTFEKIKQDDPKFDEDHWDGEMQYYKPCKPIKGLDYVVVYAG